MALAGVAVIAACMAEVASQFREAGGPYLYARAAFGRFVAIQTGWLTWLTRVAAVSAVANLFITYLSEFLPEVKTAIVRGAVLGLLFGILAVVNYRGVAGGNRVSVFFTIAKVGLLAFFVGVGLAALVLHPDIRVTPAVTPNTAGDWFEAVFLMIYAYGGFEAALIATGETRDARRDIPFALFVALVATTLLYVAVQYLVIHTIPNAGASTAPVVDSARRFLGPWGVHLVAVGTLVSAYGYLSANMLHTPRITFAMAERGDFPAYFGKIHPRFRTPHFSIVIFGVAVLLFSIAGNFRWNALLSSVARLFVYGTVAAALPVLRKKNPAAEGFRLPYGILISVLALAFVLLMISRMHFGELVVICITAGLALINWIWARKRGKLRESAD